MCSESRREDKARRLKGAAYSTVVAVVHLVGEYFGLERAHPRVGLDAECARFRPHFIQLELRQVTRLPMHGNEVAGQQTPIAYLVQVNDASVIAIVAVGHFVSFLLVDRVQS